MPIKYGKSMQSGDTLQGHHDHYVKKNKATNGRLGFWDWREYTRAIANEKSGLVKPLR
jgi:hypothetical protein